MRRAYSDNFFAFDGDAVPGQASIDFCESDSESRGRLIPTTLNGPVQVESVPTAALTLFDILQRPVANRLTPYLPRVRSLLGQVDLFQSNDLKSYMVTTFTSKKVCLP